MRYLLVIILLLVSTNLSADTDPVWRGRRVLVIGDSLIAGNSGFAACLRERLKTAPASLFIESEIGARPRTFSKDNRLHELIKEHKAESVIIVLGMNTLRSPAPVVRDSIRNLTYQLHGTECFWVGPPPLIEGAGHLLKKYRSFVEPECKYFDTSQEVKFPPKSVSGFHVKAWKGKRWAKAFLWWVFNRVPVERTSS